MLARCCRFFVSGGGALLLAAASPSSLLPLAASPSSGADALAIVRHTQQDENCQWLQMGDDLNAERQGDRFGWSMGLSGDGLRVAVGASDYDGPNNATDSGAAYVFDFQNNDAWQQVGAPVYGVRSGDHAGRLALSSNGQVLAVGSKWYAGSDGNTSSSGHVRAFVFNNITNEWVQRGQEIQGDVAGDELGDWVNLNFDGSVLAVSAPGVSGPGGEDSGLVRIFEFRDASDEWVQMGQDIDGDGRSANFASSVRLSADGRVAAMGASGFDCVNGINCGLAKVYRYDSETNEWNIMGQIIEGERSEDESGHSVALSADDGSILAVSAIKNDGVNGEDSGHVRVFKYNETLSLWVQVGSDIDGESAHDGFGWSVSLSSDGSVMAVGAFLNDGQTGEDSGHTRVYQFQSNIGWVQLGDDIDGEAAGDSSGSGVHLSADGTIVGIKAEFNQADGLGDSSGHVRVFQLPPSCFSSDLPLPFEVVADVNGEDEEGNSKPILHRGAIAGLVVAALVIAVAAGVVANRWTKTDAGDDEDNGSEAVTSSKKKTRSMVPGFKDQVPSTHDNQNANGIADEHEDPHLPTYKDQVRNSRGALLKPATVIAQPVDHSRDGAFPVALAVVVDGNDESPPPGRAYL